VDGLDEVAVGELRVQQDVVVEVILQVLRTLRPSMAIINSEDLNVGPVRYGRNFICWMDNIEDDSDPVFIVLPDEAYVSVCGESPD